MADTKFKDYVNSLTLAGALDGTEKLYVIQGGVSKRTNINAIKAYNPPPVVSAATTLTLSVLVKDYVFTGSSDTVWTLASALTGNHFIKNRGSAKIVLNSNSGSQIYTNAAVASVTINPGEAYMVVGDGTYYNIG